MCPESRGIVSQPVVRNVALIMSIATPKENLTAWQRWELGGFEQPKGLVARGSQAAGLTTAKDVEHIHRDAHKQGYDAGYAEGAADARKEAERLRGLVEQFDAALAGIDQQVAEEVLGLSLEVARQMVCRTLVVKPTAILDILHNALMQLPHQHAAIHLHPEDASLVRSHLGDQLAHAGHRIFEDGTINRGGVHIDAGGSRIDATMETRWKRVIEAIGADDKWLEQE